MASLKQNGRRRGFSEGRFQATDWLSRGALFKRAFPSLPLAGATDTSPPWLSVCVRLLLRSCVFLDGPCLYFVPMPGDSRLKPSTQRAFGSRKKRAWNKKAPATSAPSAAELESRPDPLDLPGTSTDDTVGPSSTSETLRVDAAYYSTAEQAQRVERSAQTKTVLSGKSATQRKFDLLGVSAECQTGDAGTDFLLVDMKVLNNFFAQAKCDKCDAKSLSVRKATDKEEPQETPEKKPKTAELNGADAAAASAAQAIAAATSSAAADAAAQYNYAQQWGSYPQAYNYQQAWNAYPASSYYPTH
ncbi:hypothetical protein HPB52_013163 [Rhipicephalus sanguineus]|uniref:Uncharacterized protein n=1 Tax=Rhipicephalus sanguineus TaxID=34632 RepID=A0A9D4PGV1_RHISA|nr:hypothetical protein HPB52_013163 [Rhipicephalus sanguineus]